MKYHVMLSQAKNLYHDEREPSVAKNASSPVPAAYHPCRMAREVQAG
jgi:hypothetical protein